LVHLHAGLTLRTAIMNPAQTHKTPKNE